MPDNSRAKGAQLMPGTLMLAPPATDDVRDASFFTTAEDELTVKVWRDGAELALTVTPADHPTSAHISAREMPRLQAIPTSGESALPPLPPFNEER